MWASTPMHSERQSWRSWTIKRLASYQSLSLSRFEIGRGAEMGLLHSWELDQHRIMLLLIQCLLSTNFFAKRVLEFALNLPRAVVTIILIYKKHETVTKLVLRFCSTIRSFCMLQLGCYTARGSVKLLFVLLVPVWNAWMTKFTDDNGHSWRQDLAVMMFSVEEVKKLGAIVCAGVPQVAAKRGFRVLDWLHAALQPIDGATVFVKGGIAMGQVPTKNTPKNKNTHTHSHSLSLSLSLSTFP